MKPHEDHHKEIIDTLREHLSFVLEDTCELAESNPYESLAHHVNQVWFKTGRIHGREVSRALFRMMEDMDDLFKGIDILIFVDGTYDKDNLSFSQSQYIRVDFRTQKPHTGKE